MGARRYEVTRTIDAPAETIWGYLTEAEDYRRWNDAVISIEGSIRQGARIRLVSIADPERTFELLVAETSPPHHMVWSDGMPLGLFTGRRTFTITETGDNTSEFTMVEELTGPLAPLISRAVPDLTTSFATFADCLVAAAETPEAP